MCGIALYIGSDNHSARHFVEQANNLLAHRGPDGKGVFIENGIAMAHRRLSILDLSEAGAQPMTSADGRYVIIHNGEVYNHLDLRNKFLKGHNFRGHSDTETLIELFALKKEKMLTELVGMWAFAIWDKAEHKMFVSRDRFGQKPLFWRKKGNEIMFASEIAPLLDERNNEVNYTALTEYLALGNYGHISGQSFFNEINTFLPASYCYIDIASPSVNPLLYWNIPALKEKDRRPWDAVSKNQLHDAVVEAVLSQTLSDVPIGITLSGGIDSSVIAGILFHHYDKPIDVFTAQTPGSKYNEMPYVQAVLNKADSKKYRLHKLDLNELSLVENLEKYIQIQGEPFGDPSIIAHGSLMQKASEVGTKVLLGGQGADELFFGYNNFVNYLLAHQIRTGRFKAFSENLRNVGWGSKQIPRILLMAALPFLERSMRIRSRAQRRKWLPDKWKEKVRDEDLFIANYSDREQVWKESLSHVHLPHLLLYDDHNSMAYSVETRTPFLDHRLYEIVAQIKSNDMLVGGVRKGVLRDACSNYLPVEILERKDKIGFYTPLQNVMTREKDWVEDRLKAVEKLDTQNDYLIRYRLLSASIWLNSFGVNLKP